MTKIYTLIAFFLLSTAAMADGVYYNLSAGNFSQNWADASMITADDNWTGVPSIQGFLGDNAATTSSPYNIQTQVALGTGTQDVIANQTNTGITNGGVAEFAITNPTIALQGSGTADYPFILLYMNTTGVSGLSVNFTARDIDGSTDDAVQQLIVQYRIGETGDFINVPNGYFADVTSGPSLATLVTNVSLALPVACENVAQLQIRIMTGNAASNDEWVGIDDITVISQTLLPIRLQSFTGNTNGSANQLNWQAETTSRNELFEIEHSTDGSRFANIGQVRATGNGTNAYSFTHHTPVTGTNFYRLKMVEATGKILYSAVLKLSTSKGKNGIQLLVWDKAAGNVQFNYTTETAARLQYSLVSANGTIIATQQLPASAGTTSLRIHAANAAAGVYYLTVQNGSVKETQAVLVY